MSNRKLNMKDKYRLLTRDLEWEYSYREYEEIFKQESFEGIKITDWSKWEDPFRLTMDSYWKYQAEKEKKLYAIFDAFAQNNGQQNVTDARYVNAIKLLHPGDKNWESYAFNDNKPYPFGDEAVEHAEAQAMAVAKQIEE